MPDPIVGSLIDELEETVRGLDRKSRLSETNAIHPLGEGATNEEAITKRVIDADHESTS